MLPIAGALLLVEDDQPIRKANLLPVKQVVNATVLLADGRVVKRDSDSNGNGEFRLTSLAHVARLLPNGYLLEDGSLRVGEELLRFECPIVNALVTADGDGVSGVVCLANRKVMARTCGLGEWKNHEMSAVVTQILRDDEDPEGAFDCLVLADGKLMAPADDDLSAFTEMKNLPGAMAFVSSLSTTCCFLFQDGRVFVVDPTRQVDVVRELTVDAAVAKACEGEYYTYLLLANGKLLRVDQQRCSEPPFEVPLPGKVKDVVVRGSAAVALEDGSLLVAREEGGGFEPVP